MCQFHQRFTRAFFVRNFGAKKLQSVGFCNAERFSFWHQNIGEKSPRKNVDEIDGIPPTNEEKNK